MHVLFCKYFSRYEIKLLLLLLLSVTETRLTSEANIWNTRLTFNAYVSISVVERVQQAKSSEAHVK